MARLADQQPEDRVQRTEPQAEYQRVRVRRRRKREQSSTMNNAPMMQINRMVRGMVTVLAESTAQP